MSLFDKCTEFVGVVDRLRALGQFFYLRVLTPAATPVVTMTDGKRLIQLGSNNYLGLTSHPKVVEAAVKSIEDFGTGSCSSRVLTGTTRLHVELERRLASLKGTEDCVVFSAGFMTMMGTIQALAGDGDVILSDELNHACIIDGCRLSAADVKVYRHNDMKSLEQQLASCGGAGEKLIVTDGVFSMKGTVANLPEIKRLASRYGAAIMVDDAHGTGVLGAKGHGTLEHFGMEGQVELVCGTFSKSLASTGGFTCATKEVAEFLRLRARSFVFTASPPPSVMATVLAALDVIEECPDLLKQLHENARYMRRGLAETGFKLEQTVTPIIPVLIGDDEKTFQLTGQLEAEGVLVNPVVPPAVPAEDSLIRVSIMANHSEDDLSFALEKFRKVGKSVAPLTK